jgi:hypothetical protein
MAHASLTVLQQNRPVGAERLPEFGWSLEPVRGCMKARSLGHYRRGVTAAYRLQLVIKAGLFGGAKGGAATGARAE